MRINYFLNLKTIKFIFLLSYSLENKSGEQTILNGGVITWDSKLFIILKYLLKQHLILKILNSQKSRVSPTFEIPFLEDFGTPK